jgi:hypothetical protein
MKTKKIFAALGAALALAASASASATIVLDFEGAGSAAYLNGFYNGGTDSAGNTGVNHGIAFGPNALALKESDPIANIGLTPSPETVMFFLSGTAILNYAGGFDSFSFWYSTTGFSGTVSVFDGLDGSGNLLGSVNLDALGVGPSPGNPFSNWAKASLAFAGAGKSINFGGTVNQVIYDDITLGNLDAVVAVPEPGVLGLFGLGALAVGWSRRRKTAPSRLA